MSSKAVPPSRNRTSDVFTESDKQQTSSKYVGVSVALVKVSKATDNNFTTGIWSIWQQDIGYLVPYKYNEGEPLCPANNAPISSRRMYISSMCRFQTYQFLEELASEMIENNVESRWIHADDIPEKFKYARAYLIDTGMAYYFSNKHYESQSSESGDSIDDELSRMLGRNI